MLPKRAQRFSLTGMGTVKAQQLNCPTNLKIIIKEDTSMIAGLLIRFKGPHKL
jgi:hypothetical protein